MTPQFRLAPLAIALIVSSVAISSAAAASMSMAPAVQTKTTKSYVFKLSIGMSEQMWTPAQVKSQHPKSGEVMISGAMGAAMSMAGSMRHLEVHITSRSTGKVVTGAYPTITMIDTSVKNAMTSKVPVAVMEGVGQGTADLHYGNNVHMVAGHTCRITVTVNGEHAVFQIKVPAA